MKLKFVLTGVLIAGLAVPALAVEGKDSYHIAKDMAAKKCSVVKNDPTTGAVGAGKTYDSEADAKAAMGKMADCVNKGM
jgi:hypothetical protein